MLINKNDVLDAPKVVGHLLNKKRQGSDWYYAMVNDIKYFRRDLYFC